MVKAIHAIWKDGRIIPTQPVDWPDGTTLTVEPVEELRETESEGGLLGNDPAAIARWTASYDALPPLRMSASEEAEWQAARRDVKGRTVAKMRELSIEDRS
jgi:hypothetical protein